MPQAPYFVMLIGQAWMPSHADTTGCRAIAGATAVAAGAAGYRRKRLLYRGWLPVRWVVPFTLPGMVTPRTCSMQLDAVIRQVRMPAILAPLNTALVCHATCCPAPTLTLSVVRPFLACGLNS